MCSSDLGSFYDRAVVPAGGVPDADDLRPGPTLVAQLARQWLRVACAVYPGDRALEVLQWWHRLLTAQATGCRAAASSQIWRATLRLSVNHMPGVHIDMDVPEVLLSRVLTGRVGPRPSGRIVLARVEEPGLQASLVLRLAADGRTDTAFILLLHAGDQPRVFTLPGAPYGERYSPVIDTSTGRSRETDERIHLQIDPQDPRRVRISGSMREVCAALDALIAVQ